MIRPTEMLAPLALALCACAPSATNDDAASVEALEALVGGRALDGREGLELYAPRARATALAHALDEARAWGGAPEQQARLDEILARDDGTAEMNSAVYADLLAFQADVMVFTESFFHPGLDDVTFDGDSARAFRVGENPGGTFREELRFVRVDAAWYIDLP